MPERQNLSPREELVRIQKTLFRKNQRYIEESILVPEAGFEAYQKNYLKRVLRYQKQSNLDELKKSLARSSIVFVGDYHTNKQSQRAFLRVLKLLKTLGRKTVIALELIHKRDQQSVDQYLAKKISEEEFVKKTHLKRRWYFDLWKNFKAIFDFAQYHKLPLYGVEAATKSRQTLSHRDLACAEYLAEIAEKHPDAVVVVLIGDLHLAPEHLPLAFQKEAEKRALPHAPLILYQNSEQIYWQLAKKGLEQEVEIVRVNERDFCLINTPPIVWQQSYLDWLEQEDSELDYADAKHHFLEITERIINFLGIELDGRQEEVEVQTCGDFRFLRSLREDTRFSRQEVQVMTRQILSNESYYIPKIKMVYLASLSLNHAAEEASHFIRHLCAGDEFPRNVADAFYANVLHEALGFFGSKLINHHRKCFHDKDFLNLLIYLKDPARKIPSDKSLECEIALQVLEHKTRELQGVLLDDRKVRKQSRLLFFGLTHALGYMLGDRLFYGLMKNKITKSEIRTVFNNPFKQEGEPQSVYLKLIQKVGKVRLPKRV